MTQNNTPHHESIAHQRALRNFYRFHATRSGTRAKIGILLASLIFFILITYNHIQPEIPEIPDWDGVNSLGGFALGGTLIYSLTAVYEWARGRFASSTTRKIAPIQTYK